MIKVVELCHVHFPAWKDTYFDGRVEPARTELRMTIWEPKDSSSQAIVTPGYAISVDCDYSIEYLLKTAQYKAYQGADKRLVCENDCNYYGNLESVTVDLKPAAPPEYKMSAHLLGHYHGKPVWALFSPTGNCGACVQKDGYTASVVYNKETVEGTLARCADADFFTSFLQDKKVKFSQNWKKAKAKVTQVHIDIGNARKDYLHKASHAISQNHAIVCIEDLQIRNMSKSSKGNAETHGKQVRQKSGLNRAILDQGWGEFRRQLDYKLAWRGGHLIAVPPHNTSRTCPACGHVSADNRQTQAKFECVECGFEENADVVGAINVLERGQRLLACGELAQSGRSMKQEPAEAI